MNGAPTTICAELRRVAPSCAAPHFHFVLISYCCATFSFRAYVHTSSSGEIAAAGTAASAQYALRPWSATPTSSGDSDAFRAKKSQFFTKSVITDEPKVSASMSSARIDLVWTTRKPRSACIMPTSSLTLLKFTLRISWSLAFL